jgi:alanyl-tRNA synthetase
MLSSLVNSTYLTMGNCQSIFPAWLLIAFLFNILYQQDACKMAWMLLTEVYKLPTAQLFVTYFGGDSEHGLEPDLECRDIWLQLG